MRKNLWNFGWGGFFALIFFWMEKEFLIFWGKEGFVLGFSGEKIFLRKSF